MLRPKLTLKGGKRGSVSAQGMAGSRQQTNYCRSGEAGKREKTSISFAAVLAKQTANAQRFRNAGYR